MFNCSYHIHTPACICLPSLHVVRSRWKMQMSRAIWYGSESFAYTHTQQLHMLSYNSHWMVNKCGRRNVQFLDFSWWKMLHSAEHEPYLMFPSAAQLALYDQFLFWFSGHGLWAGIHLREPSGNRINKALSQCWPWACKMTKEVKVGAQGAETGWRLWSLSSLLVYLETCAHTQMVKHGWNMRLLHFLFRLPFC